MWFSMASTTPLSSAIFTLSLSIFTMASIWGPWGSLRNISDEATIRMMSAPMNRALGTREFISRQASSFRPASRPSGCPQANTRSMPFSSNASLICERYPGSRLSKKHDSNETPSTASSAARLTKS